MICSEYWQSGGRYLNMGNTKIVEISNIKLEVFNPVQPSFRNVPLRLHCMSGVKVGEFTQHF